MHVTAPKLKKRATISKWLIISFRKTQLRMEAQIGDVLKIVVWTVRGTIARPKVLRVNPTVPRKLLTASMHRSSGSTLMETRMMSTRMTEPISMTSVRMRQKSSAFTFFSLMVNLRTTP